jgi:hypothetical protein
MKNTINLVVIGETERVHQQFILSIDFLEGLENATNTKPGDFIWFEIKKAINKIKELEKDEKYYAT